ncbi:AcvB/VirJ family lysyl-phosphatidylglycerol hydrolase [Methylopila henanensis]|uniref:AcvB/VirJ family lysyl-phosphatidylglycerol hydrolase n=1 Tax=Methylopila henanensis TaxID=873516 RepID=A0ABW4K664_9HYPH
MTARRLLLALACAAALAGSASADDLRRATAGNETVANVPIVAPADEPEAIVALISDMDGWTPARAAEAEALARQGALVIGVDLPRWLEGLGREKEDCVFLPGDVEEWGRLAGKELGLKRYRFPVLLGVGRGADVAYAALSQAPANMFTGAVSVGFTGKVPLAKPLCDGPKTETRDGANLVLGSDTPAPLQGEWRVLTDGPAPQAVKDFVAPLPTGDVVEQPAGSDMAAAARDAALDIGGSDADAVNDLPLVLYPPKQPDPKGLVVIYAGDGGWRDLDKTLAEEFQTRGYGVVGVDTLRYFWNEKTPREMGEDLEAILGRYGPEWKAPKTLLAGYSFGADVIPFAWGRISKQTRDSVRLIALLGLSKTADFELSVSGWLGVKSGEHDVLKPAAALPMDRVLCIYGKDELKDADNDVACATDTFPPSARLEEPGGHHFDENYEALAAKLDDAFATRAAAGR